MKLTPKRAEVDAGTWVFFNCSASCRVSGTHTIKWFVGDSLQRQVDAGFFDRTGIKAEHTVLSSCPDDEILVNQLKIYASSADLVNRTPVQCAALRKSPFFTDHFSYYGVITVHGTYMLLESM